MWDAGALRDFVRGYVVEHLGSPDAALVLDDTQALKKGTKSVGVAPQYYGLTGDTANVQTMVMLTYAGAAGHAFVDRELYLPEVWTGDPARCAAAGIPADRVFMTKPQLGVLMLARALAAGAPFRWVVADSGYGKDPAPRAWCHEHAVSYVLAVPKSLVLLDVYGAVSRPDRVHRALPAGVWERRSCGDGTKGVRYYDWVLCAVTVKGQVPAEGFEHTLLVRKSKTTTVNKRGRAVYAFEYFLVHAPSGTTMAQMLAAAGLRWKIEENNHQGKDTLGLDQYQVRKWTGWHRHVTCAMLALAFLVVARAELGKEAQPRESEQAC